MKSLKIATILAIAVFSSSAAEARCRWFCNYDWPTSGGESGPTVSVPEPGTLGLLGLGLLGAGLARRRSKKD